MNNYTRNPIEAVKLLENQVERLTDFVTPLINVPQILHQIEQNLQEIKNQQYSNQDMIEHLERNLLSNADARRLANDQQYESVLTRETLHASQGHFRSNLLDEALQRSSKPLNVGKKDVNEISAIPSKERLPESTENESKSSKTDEELSNLRNEIDEIKGEMSQLRINFETNWKKVLKEKNDVSVTRHDVEMKVLALANDVNTVERKQRNNEGTLIRFVKTYSTRLHDFEKRLTTLEHTGKLDQGSTSTNVTPKPIYPEIVTNDSDFQSENGNRYSRRTTPVSSVDSGRNSISRTRTGSLQKSGNSSPRPSITSRASREIMAPHLLKPPSVIIEKTSSSRHPIRRDRRIQSITNDTVVHKHDPLQQLVRAKSAVNVSRSAQISQRQSLSKLAEKLDGIEKKVDHALSEAKSARSHVRANAAAVEQHKRILDDSGPRDLNFSWNSSPDGRFDVASSSLDQSQGGSAHENEETFTNLHDPEEPRRQSDKKPPAYEYEDSPYDEEFTPRFEEGSAMVSDGHIDHMLKLKLDDSLSELRSLL